MQQLYQDLPDEIAAKEEALNARTREAAQREEDVGRRKTVLDQLTEEINQMVGDIADRFGVGKPLHAFRDHLKVARHDLGDDALMIG